MSQRRAGRISSAFLTALWALVSAASGCHTAKPQPVVKTERSHHHHHSTSTHHNVSQAWDPAHPHHQHWHPHPHPYGGHHHHPHPHPHLEGQNGHHHPY